MKHLNIHGLLSVAVVSLDCVSDALNSLFAILHYAYWCIMNRSELHWLTKHIKSHLMSADSRGKSRCHFEFSLGLALPHKMSMSVKYITNKKSEE